MPDDSDPGGPLANLFKLPGWLQNSVAAVVVVSGVIGNVAAYYRDHFTHPLFGITFEDPERFSSNSKGLPQKIIQYEVRNPGPGNLKDLELVVKVAEQYDYEKKSFVTDFRFSGVNTSAISFQPSDGHTEIIIKPSDTDGVPQLNNGERFGIKIVSMQSGQSQSRGTFRHRGRSYSADATMPEEGYGGSVSVIVVQTASWLLVILGSGGFVAFWLVTKRAQQWANIEAVRLSQPIIVTEVAKQLAALGQSKPPDQAAFNKLEAAAVKVIENFQGNVPKIEGPGPVPKKKDT